MQSENKKPECASKKGNSGKNPLQIFVHIERIKKAILPQRLRKITTLRNTAGLVHI